MNKSPEFDKLKELEEPGKERVRHLNQRKKEAQTPERRSDMHSYMVRQVDEGGRTVLVQEIKYSIIKKGELK